MKMRNFILAVAVLLLSVVSCLVIAYAKWRTTVIEAVLHAPANNQGEKVGDVIPRLYSGQKCSIDWNVDNYDDLFDSAKVYCFVCVKSGTETNLMYAWQWDPEWPYPLALTPSTASRFPETDPQCLLTTDGRMTLSAGKIGVQKYFMRGGAITRHDQRDGKY
ncbi:MAG: hypothetical protein NTY53_06260 [Kiritimatiellaeota bacterium]|nr:hypothetical protein [Kiritimatiellota bacterium]